MAATTIRIATAADRDALGRLGALLVETHHGFNADRFIAPTPETSAGYGRFLASQIGREDVIVLVAEREGAVAGYVYAALEGPDWMVLRGPAGVINDVVVDPAARRQGVGEALLDAALAALKAKGAPRVVLSTAAPNHDAQRLFVRKGFAPTMIEMTREWPDPA
jgi:ribosomal protein S18 acetylase RimI-like enzyme